jgi:hypothetical protein
MTTARQSSNTEFTIRSANQTLPLVRMIVEDIVELSNEVAETRARLAYLTDGRESEAHQDEYSRELSSIETTMERKSEQVDRFIQELADLDAFASSATEGFVDFQATRENVPVCLCWQLGEKEVMYWHLRNEDCSKRRLVDLPLIRQSGERHYSGSL